MQRLRVGRREVDDAAHVDVRRVLRRFDPPLGIAGVYHSHPRGPAEPSATDVAEAYYPEWIYLIVGLGGARPELRAFRIAGGRVRSIALSRPGRRAMR